MKWKENVAGSLILAILILLVLLPLITVLIQVVCPGLSISEFNLGNLSLILDVFTRPLWKKAFLNSASLSLCTTVAGLLLAGVLAHIRVKYKFPLAGLLDLVSWILMIMPSFILAQGWVFFASGNGIARSWLHIQGMNDFLFSFPGLVTVMVLCKYPMAYVAIKASLEWYPARLIHAARLSGASPLRAWINVQLPLGMPTYFSAAMLIFMDTVGDYGMSSTITAVYSFPTLPYTIYSAICSSPVRFDMAGVLSLYLVVMIVIAMTLQFYMMGKKRFDFLDTGTEQVSPQKTGPTATVLLTIVIVIFCLVALGIPVGSNFIMSFSDSFSIEKFQFTLANYQNVLQPDGALLEGVRHSLSLATVAAVIGLLIGFFRCIHPDLFSVQAEADDRYADIGRNGCPRRGPRHRLHFRLEPEMASAPWSQSVRQTGNFDSGQRSFSRSSDQSCAGGRDVQSSTGTPDRFPSGRCTSEP